MPTDDNDAYGDLDKSNLKFIYEQFLIYPTPYSTTSAVFTQIYPATAKASRVSPGGP